MMLAVGPRPPRSAETADDSRRVPAVRIAWPDAGDSASCAVAVVTPSRCALGQGALLEGCI